MKLYQGAEAIILVLEDKGVVIKIRKRKSYMPVDLLNSLIKRRTRLESSILKKCYDNGILVPRVLNVDEKRGIIVMEYIDGIPLKEYIDNKGFDSVNVIKILGKFVAKMHSLGIAHNDLTTSNVLVKENNPYIIDFGLAFYTNKIEDFAVDLHLFRESLLSRHPKYFDKLFNEFIESYSQSFEKSSLVLKRLEDIEKRGRYIER